MYSAMVCLLVYLSLCTLNVAGDDVYIGVSVTLLSTAAGGLHSCAVTVKGTLKVSLNTATTISFMRQTDCLSRGVLPIVVSLSLIEEPHRSVRAGFAPGNTRSVASCYGMATST